MNDERDRKESTTLNCSLNIFIENSITWEYGELNGKSMANLIAINIRKKLQVKFVLFKIVK